MPDYVKLAAEVKQASTQLSIATRRYDRTLRVSKGHPQCETFFKRLVAAKYELDDAINKLKHLADKL